MKKYKLIIITIVAMIVISSLASNDSEEKQETTTIAVHNEVSETTNKKIESNENNKSDKKEETTTKKIDNKKKTVKLNDIPSYTGNAYTIINNNQPTFTDEEITTTSYETYSTLDYLGRCGIVEACVGQDIMPTEERGSIGHVRPSGWQTVKYDNVDGKYLYNRCHLIGYQLTGENDNVKNLITGTRYFNVEGMLPFENLVADYVKETKNHVMYRVTPLYNNEELIARGVILEGYSVEDDGAGVSFNVFCYNVQPDIEINYANGNSKSTKVTSKKEISQDETSKKKTNDTDSNTKESNKTSTKYILNMNSYKFHYPSCYSVDQMSESNKGYYTGDRDDLINQGYDPCGNCNP